MDVVASKAKRYLILFNVALSVFMATLDGSIVNIALPVMSKELMVDISSIQWVVTSYLITISVLLLIWGKISDLYGKKYIFAAGFAIFTLGSFFCGLSQNLGLLIFSRIIQAIGASSIMALSQGIITSTFPPEERGKALGINGTTVALGSLVGPTLGGLLVHSMGWKSIFFINIPIGIVGTALTLWSLTEGHVISEKNKFDVKGSIFYSATITLLFLGLLLVQEGSITLFPFIIMVLVSILSLVLFIRQDLRFPFPLLDLSIFRNSVFTLGISSAFLSFVSIYAYILFMPFYLQQALSLDIRSAALLMSAYPLTTGIIAPVSGWLSDKFSYRPLTIAGLFLSSVSYALLSTLNTSSSMLKISFLVVSLGMGMALFMSPNNSSVMGSVPRNKLGVAGGINALSRNLGMVSGITLSVMLFSFFTHMNMNNLSDQNTAFNSTLFLKGFRIVLIAAAITNFIGFLISLVRVTRVDVLNKQVQ